MTHIRRLSKLPRPASSLISSSLSPAETLVLLLLTAGFSDWDNYSAVIQNLQKYYEKT